MKGWAKTAVIILTIACVGSLYVKALANGPEEQKEKSKVVTVVGKITATIDENGKVKSVLLTKDDKTTNSITLTLKGKTLGKEMNRKKVEIKGSLTDSKLTVITYKERKPESSKPKE
jgi:flagellar basal body-associated protein FliL